MHTVATLEPHQRRAFSAGFFCEVLANEYAVLLIHGPENPIGSLTQVQRLQDADRQGGESVLLSEASRANHPSLSPASPLTPPVLEPMWPTHHHLEQQLVRHVGLTPQARQPEAGGQCGGGGYDADDGAFDSSESNQYYCPICMMYFRDVSRAACCGNYICRACALQYVQAKSLKVYEKVTSNQNAAVRVECPFCNEKDFMLSSVNPIEEIRKYEDSPVVSNPLRLLQDYENCLHRTGAGESLRVGESFASMHQKMIGFESVGWRPTLTLQNNPSVKGIAKSMPSDLYKEAMDTAIIADEMSRHEITEGVAASQTLISVAAASPSSEPRTRSETPSVDQRFSGTNPVVQSEGLERVASSSRTQALLMPENELETAISRVLFPDDQHIYPEDAVQDSHLAQAMRLVPTPVPSPDPAELLSGDSTRTDRTSNDPLSACVQAPSSTTLMPRSQDTLRQPIHVVPGVFSIPVHVHSEERLVGTDGQDSDRVLGTRTYLAQNSGDVQNRHLVDTQQAEDASVLLESSTWHV